MTQCAPAGGAAGRVAGWPSIRARPPAPPRGHRRKFILALRTNFLALSDVSPKVSECLHLTNRRRRKIAQGRAAEARLTHAQEVAGSNPAPATKGETPTHVRRKALPMPRHDTPYRPAKRFPSVSTGIMLIQRQPKLAVQLADVFGEERSIEILFDTLPWRQALGR